MTSARRLAAYLVSFSCGFGVPLMALATVQEGTSDASLGYNSSSRVLAYNSMASQDEMEALRVRLWALTEHGGTTHCNIDGITAPCVNAVSD